MGFLGRIYHFRFAVFHQPNQKFPQKVAQDLGFKKEQYQDGLLSPEIGNTYAGSSILGLTAVLDKARAGDLILVVSFGSGAGSDAFCFEVTEKIEQRRQAAPLTGDYIKRARFIDYNQYARFRNKIKK